MEAAANNNNMAASTLISVRGAQVYAEKVAGLCSTLRNRHETAHLLSKLPRARTQLQVNIF